MTTRRLDIDYRVQPKASEVSAAGTVTKDVRVDFDDTVKKDRLIIAMDKAKETIIRYFDDKTN